MITESWNQGPYGFGFCCLNMCVFAITHVSVSFSASLTIATSGRKVWFDSRIQTAVCDGHSYRNPGEPLLSHPQSRTTQGETNAALTSLCSPSAVQDLLHRAWTRSQWTRPQSRQVFPHLLMWSRSSLTGMFRNPSSAN